MRKSVQSVLAPQFLYIIRQSEIVLVTQNMAKLVYCFGETAYTVYRAAELLQIHLERIHASIISDICIASTTRIGIDCEDTCNSSSTVCKANEV